MSFFSNFGNRIEKHRHLRWLRRLTTTQQMKNQASQDVSYFLFDVLDVVTATTVTAATVTAATMTSTTAVTAT